MGWVFAHLLAPVAGWRRRIRDNLALARPDLDHEAVEILVRAVPENTGRSLAEIYSGDAFTARIRASDPLEGPGLPALETAFETGRPVIIACAHFGNYDTARAALASAERYVLQGNAPLALQSAEQAMTTLPQGSADWIRAQDIAILARDAVERQRRRR